MKKILFLTFLLLLLTTVSAQQGPGSAGPPGQIKKQHDGRVIVRFRGQAQVLDGSGPVKAILPQMNLFAVDNPKGVTAEQAIARYKNNPNVLYVEPDYRVEIVGSTPDDPKWVDGSQWDMAQISAAAAWSGGQTDASDIVVAVIDTGIAYTHPDLSPNLWTDDAKGTLTGVAGAHGFTCVNGVCTAGGADDFGHGSHVAGTIGAAGNNTIGIAGINWHVQLLSMKFLDSTGGGYISDAVAAFNKIIALKQAGVNIRVTNNSWGGGEFTQALKDAMKTAEDLGILDVCAAGNSGINADSSPMFPAAYNNRGIVSVAASGANDVGASFSNIGLATVDIAAPGVSTLSTVPVGTCQYCTATGYNTLSGTSMATPHVSGVAAALFHISPSSSAYKIRDVLLNPSSFDTVTDARLKVTSTVGGRLNFASAIGNSLLSSPNAALNNFPTLTPPSDVGASGNATITLTASATDLDANDKLTLGWAPLVSGSAIFSSMLNTIFPTPAMNTNPVSFVAPSLGRTAFARYTASVADGRGGSDSGSANVQIYPTGIHGQPTGNFSLSTHSVPVNGTVTLNFANLSDPDGQQPIYWQAWFLSSTVWGEMCCLSADNPTFNLPMSYAGAYRVSVQAINKALNLSPKYSDVLSVGGVTGTPPIASTIVDKLEGVAPLTVNLDMTASAPGGSPLSSYVFYCPDGTKISSTPKGSCTFPTVGNYYLWTTVKDTAGLMDASKTYITVLPSSGTPPPPSPDFSLSPSPTSRTVTAGSSTTYSVTVLGVNGFSGNVANFSASGLPAGASASFSPTSVASGGTSTMTVTTNNGTTTPAGSFPLTITGISGSLTRTTSVTLVVNAPPAPDFSLTPSPTSRTITAGASTTYSITVNGVNGFSGTVSNFGASGLPSGASASFNPTSATSGGSSTMTVTTNNGTTTPAGSYPLKITGTSGTLTHTTSVTLVVNSAAPPSVSISVSASPSSLTMSKGGSKSTLITVTPSGFTGSVTLSATGLPNGGSATFSPATVSVSGTTSASSTMTIKTSNGTKPRTYPVTVTGSGGGVTSSTTVNVIVQ